MHRSGVNARGFTLIELLLTVAIIGIAAGVVTLSVRGAEMRKLNQEADRLGALFRMAASEARVGGRTLVWQADLEGYRFRPLVADSDYLLRDELARDRAWGVEVRAVEAHELMFTREPLRAPATVDIRTGDHRLRVALDALGNPRTECVDEACAASR